MVGKGKLMKDHLFIGGSVDGKFLGVPAGRTHWEVSRPHPNDTGTYIKETYRRELFRAEDTLLYIYVLDTMTLSIALIKLIHGYKRS